MKRASLWERFLITGPDAVPASGVSACVHADTVPTEAGEILAIALDIGALLLRFGGEVHRVEDTITRICRAYGAEGTEVFAVTSMIVAEVRMPDGSFAGRTRRIHAIYQHLSRLEELNSLSRAICDEPMTSRAVYAEIDRIRRLRPIPEWLCYLSGMIITGSFSVFFGGSLRDGAAAAVIGLLLTLASRLHPLRIHPTARLLISTFFGGILSIASVRIGFGQHIDKVMIGTIMLEIPGLSFGNALRDLLCGETLSGTIGVIQTVLQALVIAMGYMAAFLILKW